MHVESYLCGLERLLHAPPPWMDMRTEETHEGTEVYLKLVGVLKFVQFLRKNKHVQWLLCIVIAREVYGNDLKGEIQ